MKTDVRESSLGRSIPSARAHSITVHDQRGRIIVVFEVKCVVAQLNSFQQRQVYVISRQNIINPQTPREHSRRTPCCQT